MIGVIPPLGVWDPLGIMGTEQQRQWGRCPGNPILARRIAVDSQVLRVRGAFEKGSYM